MQEDLAVAIGDAAIDGVAAHDGNDVRILLGLVFPEDLGVVLQVERKDRVRERPMDIHDVADDERPAFVAAQNAGRERPRHLQLADVVGRDLLELRVPMVGVISCRHRPFFRVLRHPDQFIIRVSSAGSNSCNGAEAGCEQEIAHQCPPCDGGRGLTDTRTLRSAAGRHPSDGKSFRQRVTALRGTRGTCTRAPPSLRRNVRIPVDLTPLKPETVAKVYARLCADRNRKHSTSTPTSR